MKILVLGVSGMLGSAVFRVLSDSAHDVYGTCRNNTAIITFPEDLRPKIITGISAESQDSITKVFSLLRPDVVINCIGLVKQIKDSNQALASIPINSLLPHRLNALCAICGGRLIHISTDCVFSGQKGNYEESDVPDSTDMYGKTKLLGEVLDGNAVTLRTSIIGTELFTKRSLVNWFLSQSGSVSGYQKAIFSGLPTVELACVIRDIVLTNTSLQGLYHVAADAIDKCSLLKLIASEYDKDIEVSPDNTVVIDRSLSAKRFEKDTGYQAPPWPELIRRMHTFG